MVRDASSDLPDVERFWRLHFMLGSAVFTMSSLDALKDIAEQDFNEQTRVRDVVQRLIPFVSAGMSAPIPDVLVAPDDALAASTAPGFLAEPSAAGVDI